ncbi:MAG TPA: phage baseplate assembly protein V [Acidimicrobiales bacterium]|nr:phage baseplate assembly protein V [Acidimicrobiales bacterium]
MPGDRLFGVYPAIVTDLVDPDGQGRIQVSLPWLGQSAGNPVRAWARLVSPYADDEQGLEILPEVDSEVVVAFEAGDARRPYVLGASWNGREDLPVPADRDNNLRVLRTRSGSVLEFDDDRNGAKITLRLASGRQIVLDDAGGGTVEIQQAGGGSIVMSPSGIRIDATAKVEVNAAIVEVTAGMVKVDAAMSRFSGIVQCDTLITSSVVSASYTPGAGNLW